ncbi:MAG TPA: hypothetical protein VE640_04325 [Candidatus Bathyarchaeia archaeon]|nr:hypothetical protein [Candidatus Bathyarchaeia archaeon]
MNPNPILIVAVLVVLTVASRMMTSLGRASDVMASLFVPPDRALGWPHGVQEQDAPWSWRSTAPPAEPDLPPAAVATVRLGRPVIGGGVATRTRPPDRG